MANLKGTKTEAEPDGRHSLVNPRHATSTPTTLPRRRRMATSRSAQLFLETANNEKEHAKIWFKLLHDGIPYYGLKTSRMQLTARTTNGPTCTPPWPRRLK